MRAVIMHEPGNITVEDMPMPTILEPTDAIIKLAATCICGSDLWPYRGAQPVHEQRRLQRSVSDTRRSRATRPKVSTSRSGASCATARVACAADTNSTDMATPYRDLPGLRPSKYARASRNHAKTSSPERKRTMDSGDEKFSIRIA